MEEIWIDCFGYDGIYEVSNLGRIKSLQRYVNGGHGNQRLVKERIKKLSFCKSTIIVDLSNNGIEKTHSVSNLVYFSFNKDSPLKPKEVIVHLDKNIYNNRLDNLKIETCKHSTKLNFEKGNMTLNKCINNLDKANERNRLFYSNRTHKTCKKCNIEKEKDLFVKDKLTCKSCYNKDKRYKRKLLKKTK